jgi:hypothetical protein
MGVVIQEPGSTRPNGRYSQLRDGEQQAVAATAIKMMLRGSLDRAREPEAKHMPRSRGMRDSKGEA